jgi:hypothetical protein
VVQYEWGGKMKRKYSLIDFFSRAGFTFLALPAFVGTALATEQLGSPASIAQTSKGVKSPAYIDQMAPDARVRPAPRATSKPRAAQRAKAPKGAVVVGNAQTNQPRFPSVGSGVAMVLLEAEGDRKWPSVGSGTINR